MKKLDYILFLFISFVFIFSCNTEAKFGFRKKVKVSDHKTAQTIIKSHVTKPEIKADNIDTCEIITASSADEKIILPQTFQPKILTGKLLSKKFEIKKNIEQQNERIFPYKKSNNSDVNNFALLGFILASLSLLIVLVGFFIAPAFVVYLTIFLGSAGFILSLIGLIQILLNRRKYRGLGFAISGMIIGLLSILILIFLILFIISLFLNI